LNIGIRDYVDEVVLASEPCSLIHRPSISLRTFALLIKLPQWTIRFVVSLDESSIPEIIVAVGAIF
jgi:hypothetical protein